MKNKEFEQKFSINCSETGRFIVISSDTGKRYYVEPIGNVKTDWGSIDPSSGKLTNKKRWQKYRGSIDKEESMITKENGFETIYELSPGESPLRYIEKLDEQYKKNKGKVHV